MATKLNISRYPENYQLVADNGYILVVAGSYIELDAASEFIVKAPSKSTFFTPDTFFKGNIEVEEDTVLLGNTEIGSDDSDTVEFNAVAITNLVPQTSALYDIGENGRTWNKLHFEEGEFYSGNNVGNPYARPYDPGDVYDSESNRRLGSVYLAGGMGIEKDLNVGGYIYGRVEFANTTTFVRVTATNIDYNFYLSFVDNPSVIPGDDSPVFIDEQGAGAVPGLRYNPSTGKLITEKAEIVSVEDSSDPTTGALIVKGGAGIELNVNVGEDLTAANVLPQSNDTGGIGNTSTQWAEGFIQELYTKLITSTTGTVRIDPASNLTEIIGNINVRGTNPIGTAPVVTNVLYVTVDGNDTNDGRAQDPSRACRTIGGAVNSPYYQPGTQIRVSAGFYLEDNPIRLKPYTSIMGSDIRTTFIEPINKTQDLFHVDSGCYIAFCTFLNGRSGLLQGPYAPEFNRGAYATAFPPLEGDQRIDLFHSPYIQNCTNQSGPWLYDGTMFVPNQTVQVPIAVGTGTWAKNTTSIVVRSSGQITPGMTINAGQQNPGFFNARSLMLANKPFLQEQVIAFVDQTFNSGSFTYDQAKCQRDTGLIIESIAIDLLQNSESESIFAGLQYWSQSGYVDAIGDQITTTTAAITYVKNLAVSTATSAGDATTGAVVGDRFDDILNILASGTVGVTDTIISNGTATTTATFISAYNALIAAKPSIQNQTINYINSTLTPFVYDSAKCSRDTGLIVDSLVLDLLFQGTSQSTFAGLQYWNQSGYVGGIAGEITTTTNAITYLQNLAEKIVTNDVSGTRYQSSLTQFTALPAATIIEASNVYDDFQIILDILSTGTSGVTDLIVPNGITKSTSTNVQKAFALLQANKKYIQAEVIAYVETTKTPGFIYDQTKCYRDVGYMLDSVSFDLLYGGNKQAVQSGVYYYGFDGSSTAVPGEIPQVVSAYEYIKDIVPKIIQNIPLTITYQTGTSQVFGSPGTYIEVENTQENIDRIINIITDGPSVAEEPQPISLTRATEPDIIAGATLLNANRTFIRNEVIAYIDTLYTFLFDEAKCRRDINYMIDSVAFDLLHGGNKQSIKSGVYYYNYSSTSTEIPNEIPQTTAAYNFIKSLVGNVVLATPLVSTYQSTITQVTALSSATSYEVAELKEKLDVITSIIRNGPTTAPDRIPINLETNTSTNVSNAYNLLIANKDFIVAETIAYINSSTFTTFNYSREKCSRDVGILVENVAYDAAFGGNQKSVESGLAYYDGVVSLIAGQETQTTSAIDYLNSLIQKVIVNTSCTDLLSGTGTAVQVVNTALQGGEIASSSINSLFNVITNIINNGPSFAPSIYNSTGPDAAFISAEVLMQANRKFIQQDTINWINNTFLPFPYSEIKCRRDTGLIVDGIAQDLLYPTAGNSQSTFAGLQYWNQDAYVGEIDVQLQPTLSAIEYLKELSVKIIQNITPGNDLVDRYQTAVPQVTTLPAATLAEVEIIEPLYDIILEIVGGTKFGWTDRFIPNSTASQLLSVLHAVDLLQANKTYLGAEVNAFVTATNFGFVYDPIKCARDVGYMVDAVSFDLLHGGNRQVIQNGLYYYGFSTSTSTIRNQEIQTTAAFNFLSTLTQAVIQNQLVTPRQSVAGQNISLSSATIAEAIAISSIVSTITNIITNGPTVAAPPSAIAMTASFTATVVNAYEILKANKQFIIEEVIAYIDQTYNPTSFNYNEEKCYRDVGLIVDAVSQDILLGGNQKSIEAGLAYWSAGYNAVSGQETTTTMALNYAKNLSLQVIANTPIVAQTNTTITQIINPFYQYGGDYMPQEAVRRNFNIITTIIENGPIYAPPVYAGGGLFALTGLNGADVKIGPTVTSVSTLSSGTYLVGLSTSTIGFGNNATLYFGNTLIFPLRDSEVDELSYELTGNTSTWAQRKIDPVGSMGGSLVDGAVISERSPIQSFVYDAFTQVTQGGRGVHIKNDGYAQLVSVFTIFCSIGVEVESGGIASIVNSNANFGDICLQAKGYGKRKFSGTIYNPAFLAWDSNTNTREPDLDQYYPNGFWPNNAKVLVFVPDIDDRPHISLVMEIVPPEGHLNEQNFPGFLNASPTTSTLTTGTITITGVDTEGIAVGNQVYIRDQFGKTTSTNLDSFGNWIPYAASGTVVTTLGYKSITLNKALTSGGGEIDNPNFFDFYFCGNSYYTVLSSTVSQNPKPEGINILSTASTGLSISQVPAHAAAIAHLNTLTNQVIANSVITALQTATSQVINPLVLGGAQAQEFINLRFQEMIQILTTGTVAQAEAVIPVRLRTKSGPTVQGAGSAVTLIEDNIEFLADEVTEYMLDWFQANEPTFYSFLTDPNNATTLAFIQQKCQRDTKVILQRLIYDIETGGRYNSVMVGLSYWSRLGTHYVVQLGENVTRTDLFPDGSTVNFYQRSYMSASGYVFEYVGAGTDYGALPQRGVADPNQSKEVVMLDSGKVFFTSTDQNGDFRIGPGLVISQATGVLSGRTFTKSLFANMTPFILAIEGGG